MWKDFTHGSKTFYSKKNGNKEEAEYKKNNWGSEKGVQMAVMGDNNKIEISTPKLSLIDNIWTPCNSPSKQTLEIADSGVNIHLSKQATTAMSPVIMSNYIT